jgi:hypothetical protein
MNCQDEKPNLKISKSGQSANDLISSAPNVAIAANGWGCAASWRLKQLPHPTQRSYKKAKTFPNLPVNQLVVHPLLCVVKFSKKLFI